MLGARQPRSQTREKAECSRRKSRRASGPGRPRTWGTTVSPWRWRCPLLWAHRPAAYPLPLGGIHWDSTPSVIWGLVIIW